MSGNALAILWLICLAVVVVTQALKLAAKSVYDFEENCLFVPTYLMGRILWRVHFTNSAPAELQSGAILVANHRSSVDPFFVQLAAGRRVHWMVAKEYCQHFAFGPLLRACKVIPTNRSGSDTASTKAAIRLTSEGRLVGMFPEGKINRTSRTLMPIRSGAAVVAQKADAPLIPLLINGSPYRDTVWSPVFMPAHVQITFGAPIPPSTTASQVTADDRNQTDSGGSSSTSQGDTSINSSDALMQRWGEQMVELAGQPDCPVEFASARKRRRRS